MCVWGLDHVHFYLDLEVEGFKCTKTKTNLTPGMTVETTPGTIGTCNNMAIINFIIIHVITDQTNEQFYTDVNIHV